MEVGDLYFRYYTQGGQLSSGGSPVELVTPYPIADIAKLRWDQEFDTQYFTHESYPVYKHQRTNATTFTITEVSFVRGPFLDDNITATTITPSAATGSGITLTASTSIFTSDHVDSLWKVGNAVVKITAFSSGTSVTGDVQAEPDGTAGDIGGTAATTDWAEGAWSTERGFPTDCVFHEGRLWFVKDDKYYGSVLFAPENFDVGNGDDNEAIVQTAKGVTGINWVTGTKRGVMAGTPEGVGIIGSGSQGLPITPSNVGFVFENSDGSSDIQAKRMGNFIYYTSNDKQRMLEAGYAFEADTTNSEDATLLADHILNAPVPTSIPGRFEHNNGGAVEMDVQKSPSKRLWVVRDDGQIAILTRDVKQEVNGWARRIGGQTVRCDGESGKGVYESIAIEQRDGEYDRIWVQVNRLIGSSVTRFVEYFTAERFKYDWDAVRLDSSLTLDSPITIAEVIILSGEVLINATAHGLSNGDNVRLDNIVGTHQLNGNVYEVYEATTDFFKIQEIA